MSHVNKVFDSDPHFTISPITRQIVNDSSKKTTLIQFDHDSERFSFSLAREVEGHDMTECNQVEVHFINTGTKAEEVSKDVYEVKDLQISSDDEETLVFSWLLSNKATMYEGKLSFLIRFACTDKEGNVEYAWHTAIHGNITISKGMNNADDVVTDEMSDILAQWKAELFGTSEEGVKNIYTAKDAGLEAITEAKDEAVGIIKNEGGTAFANAIKATASGEIIHINDISPIEHSVSVKLSSDTVTDFSEVKLNVQSGSLFKNDTSLIKEVSYISSTGTETKRMGYKIELPVGTYTIRAIPKVDSFDEVYIYGCTVTKDNVFKQNVRMVADNKVDPTKTFIIEEGDALQLFNGLAGSTISNTQSRFKMFDFMLEVGEVETEYKPYTEPITYTPNADGTVEGVKSIYPSMTMYTDTSGVVVNAEYNQDINKVMDNVKVVMSSIDAALDEILEIQNALIGGDNE